MPDPWKHSSQIPCWREPRCGPKQLWSIGVAGAGVLGLNVLDGILVCRALGRGENREEEGKGNEGKDLGESHVGGQCRNARAWGTAEV